jgi:ADP-L-glycero-D-manno-heptose 6-epimerase
MSIVVTGAAGFIGSCLVSYLNKNGHSDLILVDDFSKEDKHSNLEGKLFTAKVERSIFIEMLPQFEVDFVFHIGARTDTTEFDTTIFDELNIAYSKAIWNYCTEKQVPLLYASSAATYGGGEQGFDDQASIENLKPLNPYGQSKQDFDVWALAQTTSPPNWYGLKFFNVFGPNEYHKGRMASVVMHAFNQIKKTNKLKLFQSHNENYKHGEQIRDFIYVKDLLDYMNFFFTKKPKSGIYNAGTGKARTFNDLANAIFKALNKEADIEYIPTPEDIRDKYQYFTEANMLKAIDQGYSKAFSPLEESVSDYVNSHLQDHSNY